MILFLFLLRLCTKDLHLQVLSIKLSSVQSGDSMICHFLCLVKHLSASFVFTSHGIFKNFHKSHNTSVFCIRLQSKLVHVCGQASEKHTLAILITPCHITLITMNSVVVCFSLL